MRLLEDLRTLLNGLSAVTSVVATNQKSNDKVIRLERLFQADPLPGIVLNLADSGPLNSLTGSGGEFNSSITVSCAGRSGKEANDLAKLVNDQLESFVGATSHGVIEAVTYDGEQSGFEPFGNNSDAGVYITEVRYVIFYRQTS